MTDIVDDLDHYAKRAMPHYPNDVCSRGKREIERLRKAVQTVYDFMHQDVGSGDHLLWTPEYEDVWNAVIAAISPAERPDVEKIEGGQ